MVTETDTAVEDFVRAAIEAAAGNAGAGENTSFREATFPVLRTRQREVVSALRAAKVGFWLGENLGNLSLTIESDDRVLAAKERENTGASASRR